MNTVIVTRPAPEVHAWVNQLEAHGRSALALPLIGIGPPPDIPSMVLQQAQASGYDALMFVSPQAVRYFADARWIKASGRCWAPGPGTAQALIGQGVDAQRIDQPDQASAQFDSEALWSVVANQIHPGHRLLLVRGLSPDGHEGRDWLKHQCEARGGQVDACTAYQRMAPAWDSEQARFVQQFLQDGSIWLFSSSEALTHLAQRLPDHDFSRVRALVTHPKIDRSARSLGFREIITTRPAFTDVLAGLQAFS